MRYLFFFLLPLIMFGQNNDKQEFQYKFEYRLNYSPDSTNVVNKKTEDFSLFVVGDKSFFASNNYFAKDSILQSVKIANNMNISNIPNTRFKYIIISDNDKIEYCETLLKYKFTYSEQPELDWKLTGKKEKIGNFNCLQAIANYGGRTWEAWFTPDIPISKGPYKFGKLPGLIVKIGDSKKHYEFNLISVSKNVNYGNGLMDEKNLKLYKKISKTEYSKVIKDINDNIIGELSSSGLTVMPESIDKVKSNVKKRNNSIELK
ncbi:GLPGLI family protein [Chryseobacterium sp. TY3]